MVKKVLSVLLSVVSLLALLLNGCAPAAAPAGQPFEVKRGDFTINVSADGNLDMPNTFDLRFGTMGKVQSILVEEGDKVKQGALLAFLDNTTQINAIITALFNIRTAANNIAAGNTTIVGAYTYTYTVPVTQIVITALQQDPFSAPGWNDVQGSMSTVNTTVTVTVPGTPACGAFDAPENYPDLSALQIFEEAQKDLDECIGYYTKGEYKDAGFKLGMTYFDIKVCADLLQSRPNVAVLAGAKSNSVYYADGTAGSDWRMWENDAMVIASLQKYRQRLLKISQLMLGGAYGKIKPELDAARDELVTGKQLVENTIHIRGRTFLTLPDSPTSLNFLQASMRSLQDLDASMKQADTTPVDIAKKLYIANMNLALGRDTLENQTLTFNWNSGYNWKAMQQYNLAVQSAEIALDKAKRDIMNTVIIAPADGTVVSVNLKPNNVLSAQDYSSRPAIRLIDTQSIRFKGLVDEIDIMKVQKGQNVKIAVDAAPGKVFTGKVTFISPFGTQVGQVIKFAVTIELDPTPVELRGGLSATADINVYSARNVLLVPISAITFTPAGPVVTVVDAAGKTEDRKVTLGKQSLDAAEVVAGLKEGDKILGSMQKGRVWAPPRLPMPR